MRDIEIEARPPPDWHLKRGSQFSRHHDAPVAFPDSMRILDATVTRRSRSGDIIGPLQRINVITALKAMTIWPAYQHFEETTKGSIETGKLGDRHPVRRPHRRRPRFARPANGGGDDQEGQ